MSDKEMFRYVSLVGVGMIPVFVGLILSLPISITAISIFAGYETGVIGCWITKNILNIQKEKKGLLQKYPYIDTTISDKVLETGLEKARLLMNDHLIDHAKEEYACYVQCEEMKENYLNETKNDGYIINPPIDPVELKKATQKIKKLGSR